MTTDMTRGNSVRLVMSFAMPLLFGNVCQQLYSIVDSIIVGQADGMGALAAIGATGGITFLIISCIQGITAGFAVITAQRFGAGDHEGVKRSIGTSAILSVMVIVFLTGVGILTARPLLELMNTPKDIIDGAHTYILITYYGVVATVFYNLLSCMIRALGDSKTPLFFLVVASLLNVGLDLLLVMAWGMGVAGAAWASAISQGVAALLCLLYALKKFSLFRLERRHWAFAWSFAWKHLKIGLPMALQFIIISIGVFVMQASLNQFGSATVAAFSAASKIHMLAENAISAFGTAMATFVGQNYGAHKIRRIRVTMKKCILICEGITLGLTTIVIIFGGIMSSWFMDGYYPDVIREAHMYLVTCSLFYPLVTILFLCRNALLGLGNSVPSLLAGICELMARTIGAPILGHLLGFFGICWINPLAWIFSTGLFFLCYLRSMRKLKPLEQEEPSLEAAEGV